MNKNTFKNLSKDNHNELFISKSLKKYNILNSMDNNNINDNKLPIIKHNTLYKNNDNNNIDNKYTIYTDLNKLKEKEINIKNINNKRKSKNEKRKISIYFPDDNEYNKLNSLLENEIKNEYIQNEKRKKSKSISFIKK